MNQNDADRYYSRTGQRWSGDSRSTEQLRGEIHLPRRVVWLLLIALLVTILGMLARVNS